MRQLLNSPSQYVVLLLALLCTAALYDVWRRKVPNVVSAALLVGGLVHFAGLGIAEVGSGFAASAITLLALWGPWMLGGIGGGDVKLASAVASWFGLGLLPTFWLSVALAGGVLATIIYFASRPEARRAVRSNLLIAWFARRWPVITKSDSGRTSVPYAVAVGAGALGTIFLSGVIP